MKSRTIAILFLLAPGSQVAANWCGLPVTTLRGNSLPAFDGRTLTVPRASAVAPSACP